jgi:hypothetical protein
MGFSSDLRKYFSLARKSALRKQVSGAVTRILERLLNAAEVGQLPRWGVSPSGEGQLARAKGTPARPLTPRADSSRSKAYRLGVGETYTQKTLERTSATSAYSAACVQPRLALDAPILCRRKSLRPTPRDPNDEALRTRMDRHSLRAPLRRAQYWQGEQCGRTRKIVTQRRSSS